MVLKVFWSAKTGSMSTIRFVCSVLSHVHLVASRPPTVFAWLQLQSTKTCFKTKFIQLEKSLPIFPGTFTSVSTTTICVCSPNVVSYCTSSWCGHWATWSTCPTMWVGATCSSVATFSFARSTRTTRIMRTFTHRFSLPPSFSRLCSTCWCTWKSGRAVCPGGCCWPRRRREVPVTNAAAVGTGDWLINYSYIFTILTDNICRTEEKGTINLIKGKYLFFVSL